MPAHRYTNWDHNGNRNDNTYHHTNPDADRHSHPVAHSPRGKP